MVEINNQRKAFLDDMLAWSEGTDNGRQKTRNHGTWRHCGRRAIFEIYSITLGIRLSPKLKSAGAGRYQLLFPLVGCLPQATAWKTSLRKVRTLWHYGRLRSVALCLWLIMVISVRQSTVAAISGLHCRALVMVSSSIRLTTWLQNSKKRAERSERLMYEQSHRVISALVICIIVCLSWAVNHYRDNHYLQSPARQKCQRTEAGERGNYWHADASAWCCCARCKIHRS